MALLVDWVVDAGEVEADLDVISVVSERWW